MEPYKNESDLHFFQSVGNQADQVFFIFDLSRHQFYYLNAAFDYVWKMNREELLINSEFLLNTIHPEDRQYVAETYGQFMAQKHKTEIEFRIVWPDTTDRWIRLWVYPIIQKDQMQFVSGIALDDSEKKKTFFEMEKITARKNATMEILSHDLKGPIATIQSLASLIEKKQPVFLDQQIIEWLKLIQQTCQRSINLIRSFVNSEFLESASFVLNRERLDLVWEIEQVMDTYKKSEEAIARVFEFTCSHTNMYTPVDSIKFLQLINNLISNAIKFTHNNGYIHIHIEEKQGSGGTPGTVLISVRDNGIGIPKAMQPCLFDKFTKARRPGLRGEESIGLGMSIIKTIVALHNGKIWFESEENKGTTFYIEIPK